jgi:hypothetical protein
MATLALARMHTANIARHTNIGQKIWTSPKIISAKLKNFDLQKRKNATCLTKGHKRLNVVASPKANSSNICAQQKQRTKVHRHNQKLNGQN